jgi:hypothetical protein
MPHACCGTESPRATCHSASAPPERAAHCQRDVRAVRHVGVPTLPGIVCPGRLAVRTHLVRQDHDLREIWLMELIGDIHLKVAKPRRERRESRRIERLPRETQHLVLPRSPQQRSNIAARQRLPRSIPLIRAPRVCPPGIISMVPSPLPVTPCGQPIAQPRPPRRLAPPATENDRHAGSAAARSSA